MRVLVFVLAGLILTGCGLTGATSKQVVAIENPQGQRAALDVAGVDMDAGESRLTNVGSYAWGKYDADDLTTLRDSLKESAAPFTAAGGYRVHVRVRRVLVSHSNSEGLALACVSWALQAPDGKLLFHEQFYASRYVRLWGTLGGIKNDVHEGIVRRILGASVRIAASGGRDQTPPSAAYTFSTFEDATRDLPTSLTSVYFGALMGGGYTIFYSSRTSGESNVAWAKKPDHFDWEAYLAKSR
jgi:hypothetical protein